MIFFLGRVCFFFYCFLKIKGRWKEELNEWIENKRFVIREFIVWMVVCYKDVVVKWVYKSWVKYEKVVRNSLNFEGVVGD